MDFANGELMDNGGDVAAAAVTRDLVRGAATLAGGKEAERRRRRFRWRLRLVVETPHVVPPPPLVLSALRRLLSADASPPICLLYTSPPVYILFASWLPCRPCCPTAAAAASASQLCLDLFFVIWLSTHKAPLAVPPPPLLL